ncbi:MAG: phosphatase PAP2 family protein [Pseudolabrys sp.]|nr:phosphatase PAP2 family protein [Pseudolabrys sp.]MDP2294271.1 phosphatase PAP2 family protein [Pseudolabrys sp.]
MNETRSGAGGVLVAAARRCAVTVAYALKRLTQPIKGYGPHPWRRGFPWFDEPQRLAIGAAIVVAFVVVGMIFIDAAASNAVRRLAYNVIRFFDWITDFGKSGWFLWPLGILFLLLAALPQNLTAMSRAVLAASMVRVGFLFVAIGAPGLFASIVKNMIGRARPGVGGSVNPYLFDPFFWTPSYASLPSGHATAAFAVLAAFGTLWPRARTVLLIYALLMAVSRVVITAHYPTDVALGALTGLIGVLLVRRWFALQRLGFSIKADGQLVQYPGPSPRRLKSVARELLA